MITVLKKKIPSVLEEKPFQVKCVKSFAIRKLGTLVVVWRYISIFSRAGNCLLIKNYNLSTRIIFWGVNVKFVYCYITCVSWLSVYYKKKKNVFHISSIVSCRNKPKARGAMKISCFIQREKFFFFLGSIKYTHNRVRPENRHKNTYTQTYTHTRTYQKKKKTTEKRNFGAIKGHLPIT